MCSRRSAAKSPINKDRPAVVVRARPVAPNVVRLKRALPQHHVPHIVYRASVNMGPTSHSLSEIVPNDTAFHHQRSLIHDRPAAGIPAHPPALDGQVPQNERRATRIENPRARVKPRRSMPESSPLPPGPES